MPTRHVVMIHLMCWKRSSSERVPGNLTTLGSTWQRPSLGWTQAIVSCSPDHVLGGQALHIIDANRRKFKSPSARSAPSPWL